MLSGLISDAICTLNKWIWSPCMLALMLGTGAYLMLKLRFLPIRRLGYALRLSVGLEQVRSGGRKKEKGVSPFAALTTELAATIGIGNIVGVATAMVLGGPGALFWMVAASLFGLATKLVESTLSVKYRCLGEHGEWLGGPMYTLSRALPKVLAERWGGGKNARKMAAVCGRVLAWAFAFFAVMASFGMGNMTQSNAIAKACEMAFEVPVELVGLIVTIATILIVLGGITSIAKATQILVPVMGGFYLLGTAGVILTHLDGLAEGIVSIMVMAFVPRAVTGGLLGNFALHASLSMAGAMRFGVSRGVFSNEAGLGAAGITAAAADTDDPVRQGYISMTGVFWDTMVICTMTGLAFAASGLLGTVGENGEFLNGTELTIAMFSDTFGGWGTKFVSVSITLFAFATIVAWAYPGEKAFEYLTGRCGSGIWYRFVYALTAFAGAVCSLETVWNFADVCNGLMAVPNLIGVLALSMGRSGICGEIREYDKEKLARNLFC